MGCGGCLIGAVARPAAPPGADWRGLIEKPRINPELFGDFGLASSEEARLPSWCRGRGWHPLHWRHRRRHRRLHCLLLADLVGGIGCREGTGQLVMMVTGCPQRGGRVGRQLRGGTMRSPNARMGVSPGTRLRGVSGQPVRSGEGVKQGARVSRHDAAIVS